MQQKEKGLKQVKGGIAFIENERYIIVVGHVLWVFDRELNFLWKTKEVKNVVKAAFIAEHEVLFDANGFYGVLSLPERAILWKESAPKRRSLFGWRFAISKDRRYAYDYFGKGLDNYLVRIPLIGTHTAEVHCLRHDFGAIHDICCDGEDNVLLLEAGALWLHGEWLVQTGVLFPYYDTYYCQSEPPNAIHWKWKENLTRKHCSPQLIYGDWVICADLHCYHMDTGEERILDTWGLSNAKDCLLTISQATDSRYIFLLFQTRILVLEWASGKHIAHYHIPYAAYGLIHGDVFLTLSGDGMVSRPFPQIEPLDPNEAGQDPLAAVAAVLSSARREAMIHKNESGTGKDSPGK